MRIPVDESQHDFTFGGAWETLPDGLFEGAWGTDEFRATRTNRGNTMSEKPQVTKCRFCAEDIKPEAAVCKHCGKRLAYDSSGRFLQVLVWILAALVLPPLLWMLWHVATLD